MFRMFAAIRSTTVFHSSGVWAEGSGSARHWEHTRVKALAPGWPPPGRTEGAIATHLLCRICAPEEFGCGSEAGSTGCGVTSIIRHMPPPCPIIPPIIWPKAGAPEKAARAAAEIEDRQGRCLEPMHFRKGLKSVIIAGGLAGEARGRCQEVGRSKGVFGKFTVKILDSRGQAGRRRRPGSEGDAGSRLQAPAAGEFQTAGTAGEIHREPRASLQPLPLGLENLQGPSVAGDDMPSTGIDWRGLILGSSMATWQMAADATGSGFLQK